MNTTTLNRERLIECRKKLGITKQQAAIRMQLSQPAYLRYESGERTPSIHAPLFPLLLYVDIIDTNIPLVYLYYIIPLAYSR